MRPVGPPDAKLVIVGEAPGEEEIRAGVPFVGMSGMELTRMLSEAGINRDDCLMLNVCNHRPPDNQIAHFFYGAREAKLLGIPALAGRYPKYELNQGITDLALTLSQFPRNAIIALGDTALWALTGESGIMKWRGSIMAGSFGKVIPTIHPAFILKDWQLRSVAVQDLRRARRESQFPEIQKPEWRFDVGPTLDHVLAMLNTWERYRIALTCDIETRAGQISCIGFAPNSQQALCIPFMSTKGNGSYWRPEEEAQILQAMIPVLLFCPLTFHNGNFDAQYIAKQWGIIPNLDNDTMIAQHVLMPGLLGGKLDPVTGVETKKGSSRSLAFVSSMYCRYHRYWKDEGRKWDPRIHPEEQHWTYNCEDCVRTNEAMGVLREALDKTGLWWQYRFLISLFKPTMKMMLRGVLIDQAKRREIRTALDEAIALRLSFIRTATSCPHFNPNSKDHMSDFFYGDMRQRKILHRKTKQPTLDDNALDTIRRREPLLAPVIDAIREIRSLGVLKNTFIEAPLCSDGRMRTSFNLAGPETFRLSSNQTAFGEGTNLQNIPKPQEYL